MAKIVKIQMRRGNYAAYNESKMSPGEIAIATDTRQAFIGMGTGDAEELAFKKDIINGGGSGTADHNQLANRDAVDQHPISAITGLQQKLDDNKGDQGVGIQSVEQTVTSWESNGVNVVTVVKTDGSSSSFEVRNGGQGDPGSAGIYVRDPETETVEDALAAAAATGATIFVDPEEAENPEAVTLNNFPSILSQYMGKLLWSNASGHFGAIGNSISIPGISGYKLVLLETNASVSVLGTIMGNYLQMEWSSAAEANDYVTTQSRLFTVANDVLTMVQAKYFRVDPATKTITQGGTPSAKITAIYGIL